MEYFKQKLQENLEGVSTKQELPLKQKKRGKPVCCVLFEHDRKTIEGIKDRGLDSKVVLTPSKIVQMGLLLLSNIQVEKIPFYTTNKNSKPKDRFELANQELGTKSSKKYKFFTFTLDILSVKLLEQILDRGLDIKRVFSVSEILRLGIQQVDTLTADSLKEYFLKLEKRKNG